MSDALTYAGATITTLIAGANIRTWWKGSRNLKALLPYGGGVVNGTSWTLCIGGVLGGAANQAVEMGNKIGDKTITGTTGLHGGGTITQAAMGALTYPGACAVLVVTGVSLLTFKAASATDKKRMGGGALTGLTLGATAGFASWMGWVPDLYNTLGEQGVNALNGGWTL